jgi:mRNA interferase MazF
MAVTSQLHATVSIGELWIADWKIAGLVKPSATKPVFFTFEQSLVLKTLGKLQSPDQNALRNNIHAILG